MISNLFLGPKKYMGFKFIRSRKGGIKLVDSQGYDYERKSEYNGRTYWRCIQHYKNKCKARVTTIDSKIVTHNCLDPLGHNHLPSEK